MHDGNNYKILLSAPSHQSVTDGHSQCMMACNYTNTRVLSMIMHSVELASLLSSNCFMKSQHETYFPTENGKCSLIISVIIRNYNSPTLTEIEFEQSLINYWNI